MRHSTLTSDHTEGKLPVTKVTAAVNQLESAIALWFSDGDPVSICTLAYAANEILRTLAAPKGHTSLIFDPTSVRPEMREEYIRLIRSEPNFMKHAGKDPHETFYLSVRGLQVVLFDGVLLYDSLGLGGRPIFKTFGSWLWISVPDFFVQKADEVCSEKLDITTVRAAGKKNYFDTFLPIFAQHLMAQKD